MKMQETFTMKNIEKTKIKTLTFLHVNLCSKKEIRNLHS